MASWKLTGIDGIPVPQHLPIPIIFFSASCTAMQANMGTHRGLTGSGTAHVHVVHVHPGDYRTG